MKNIILKKKNKILLTKMLTAFFLLIILIIIFFFNKNLNFKNSIKKEDKIINNENIDIVDIFYTTPSNYAKYNNFSFTYPSNFYLFKDFISEDYKQNKYHSVVLKNKYDQIDNNLIEINVADKLCSDYKICKEIKTFITKNISGKEKYEDIRIIIGSNVNNEENINAINKIFNNFKILPKSL